MIIASLTGNHYAAARVMLGLTQQQLALFAGVSVEVIVRFESHRELIVESSTENFKAIQAALDRCGLFLSTAGSRWVMGLK